MTQEEFISEFYSCDNEEEALKRLYSKLCCLKEENQELKKQLEIKETKQKEFIKWLEKEIKSSEICDIYVNGMRFNSAQKRMYQDVLSKYKEIIGE